MGRLEQALGVGGFYTVNSATRTDVVDGDLVWPPIR